MSARKKKRKPREGEPVVIRPPKEESEQERVIQWRDIWVERYPKLRLLHASLNGVAIPVHYAMKQIRLGMVKGFPDLFLPVRVPHFNVSGLYIEMKRRDGTGRLSPDQREIGELLKDEGFVVEVSHTWEAAVTHLIAWLDITEPEAHPDYKPPVGVNKKQTKELTSPSEKGS